MHEYDNEWVNEEINDSGKPEDQKHYQGLIQPIELMQELLSHKEFIGFCKGNMIKYAYRARPFTQGADHPLSRKAFS